MEKSEQERWSSASPRDNSSVWRLSMCERHWSKLSLSLREKHLQPRLLYGTIRGHSLFSAEAYTKERNGFSGAPINTRSRENSREKSYSHASFALKVMKSTHCKTCQRS